MLAVEALARWTHPEQGAIPPDRFIGLAESVGLMGPLTLSVLRMTLRQCALWHAQSLPLGVAINLSMANLRDPQFPGQCAALLAESGQFPPP